MLILGGRSVCNPVCCEFPGDRLTCSSSVALSKAPSEGLPIASWSSSAILGVMSCEAVLPADFLVGFGEGSRSRTDHGLFGHLREHLRARGRRRGRKGWVTPGPREPLVGGVREPSLSSSAALETVALPLRPSHAPVKAPANRLRNARRLGHPHLSLLPRY